MHKLISSLAVLAALVLAGCDKGGAESARADHISKVRSMHLETNDCPAGIRKALQQQGFSIMADDQRADAKLLITVTRTGRNLDKIPEFGGFGAKARYTAKVIGADDKVLFQTSGEEGSLSGKEMCEDIGDEIGEKLRGSPLGGVN